MSNCITPVEKTVVFVGKSGPAFSLQELEAAHAALDQANAPRKLDGRTLSLAERISWMHGQLVSARAGAAVVIRRRK